MIIGTNLRAAAFAVALSFVPASAGLADECGDMRKAISELYDKLEDKPDHPTAKRCSMMGQALGLLALSRQVFSECLEDGDRIKKVSEGDRVIRNLQIEMNKTCF